MKKLPYATTLISVVIAVALWLIATWLESDSAWSPEPGPTAAPPVSGDVREDTPLVTDTVAAGCDASEASLRLKVSESQYCASDDDCTLFDYGYPIECLTSVAKSEITTLRLEYRNYEESCPYRVYYDCPTGSMERQAVCRSNRCAVVLRSNEVLEERTLDYLGIDPRR